MEGKRVLPEIMEGENNVGRLIPYGICPLIINVW